MAPGTPSVVRAPATSAMALLLRRSRRVKDKKILHGRTGRTVLTDYVAFAMAGHPGQCGGSTSRAPPRKRLRPGMWPGLSVYRGGNRVPAVAQKGVPLFRRSLWKIDRLVGELVQIIDDVGALGVAWQARESHGGSRHISLRVGQELVELVEGPVAALALQRGRVVETGDRRFRPAHDVPEIGAHLVGAALLEAVAGDAGLGSRFTALRARIRKQHFDRLGRGRCGAMIAGGRVLLHRDLVAGLGRLRGGEDGAGRDIERQNAEAGEHH